MIQATIAVTAVSLVVSLLCLCAAIRSRRSEAYPRLSNEKIIALNSGFDGKSWDETADADRTAQ